MKKLIVPVLFCLVVLAQPFNLFAKTVCFSDNFGDFYVLSGGKFNEKPFSGNVIYSGTGCNVPLWAAIITAPGGGTVISMNSSQGNPCSSVWISASGNTVTASGHYDNGQNGTIDGTLTLTQINCSSVPPAKPSKAVANAPGNNEQ